MTRRINLLMIAALFFAVRCALAIDPIPPIFVAPDGNDAWNGTREKHGQGNDGPFATLQRALKAATALKESIKNNPTHIEINILPGEYFLSDPLVLDAKSSGSDATHFIFRATGAVLVSGGRKLTGFKPAENGRWQLEIPEVKSGDWAFSELFVNGQRRSRPRLPNDGSFFFIQQELPPSAKTGKGFDRFVYPEGALNRSWHNLSDVEITPFQNWTMSRMRIEGIDEERRAVSLSTKTPSDSNWNKLSRGRRFLIHNVFEAIRPGEWYLDTKSGVLTYVPLPGEELEKMQFIAPCLERLIDIRGGFTPETQVSNVHFNGISFKHCRVKFGPNGYQSPQAEVNVPGAIYAKGARNCSFKHCEISQVNGYAIELGAGCKDCVIDDCDLTDLGAGGVKIGDTSYRDKSKDAEIAERITVRNCFIAYGGRHYPAAIGIWIGQSPNNVIEHNEIFDFYYSALSVGWTWGYGNSNAHHNTFAYNHIHKIGQGVLTDMGGIYSLGVSPGTVIHHNLFHDIESHDYGGWGIYYDEGSTGIVSENNIVYNCKSAGFHQHYGKENIVRNNIFAFGTENQLMRTRPEEHLTLTIERNIIYYNDANILGTNWTGGKFELDHNIYWNIGKKPIKFLNFSLEEWRKKGHDLNSIIEDPLFVDAEHFNFALKANSPASKIGFNPIDLTGVGPKRERKRVEDWPRAFPPKPAPPKLEPVSINDDFEDTPVGGKPAIAGLHEENARAVIRVSEDFAVSGKRSLKFTDEAGQKAAHSPFMFYQPHLSTGTVEASFQLRLEPGAIFWHEWRTDGEPYHAGPSIHIDAEGHLTANGKKLLDLPRSQWIKFEISAPLGESTNGKYTLAISLTQQEKKTFKDLPCSADFKALHWMGFISLANAASVFYIDDVSVKPRK